MHADLQQLTLAKMLFCSIPESFARVPPLTMIDADITPLIGSLEPLYALEMPEQVDLSWTGINGELSVSLQHSLAVASALQCC